MAVLWIGAFLFVFSLWLFHGRAFNTFEPAGIDRMVDGGAARPYSARPLVPWLARAAVAPWSVEARVAWLEGWTRHRPALAAWLDYFRVTPRHAFELMVAACLDALALAGFMVCVLRLVASFYEVPHRVAWLAPVVAVLLLPLFFTVGTHYFYDLPALFFAAAVLLAIRLRRSAALALLLALGTLNKETLALALLIYLVPAFRESLGGRWRRDFFLHAGAVIGARALAVALSTPAAVTAPTDNYLRDYLVDNLIAFVRDPFLLNAPRTATLLFFGLLILAGLPRRPALLRSVLPVVVPFLALYLWGSLWREIRVLYEVFPILFLLGYATCVECLGLPIAPRAAEEVSVATGREETPRASFALASTLAGLFLIACGASVPILVHSRFAA